MLVLQDLQPVDLHPIQPGPGPGEELVAGTLGLVEVPRQVLTLGRFHVHGQHEVVVGVPARVREEAPPRLQVSEGRLVRGGSLGFAAGPEVQPSELPSLGGLVDQRPPEVQVMDDVEQPLLGRDRVPSLPQEAPHGEVNELPSVVRDHGIGGLLDPVVEEGVAGDADGGERAGALPGEHLRPEGRRHEQAFPDGLREVPRHGLIRLRAHDRQRVEVELAPDAGPEGQHGLGLG
jgi:hypothetical protein